jgi:hypothetical protein
MSLADEIAGRVSRVTVESSFLPMIDLDHPFAPGAPSPFLAALRPRITVAFENDIFKPVVMAPYGEPEAGGWARLKMLALVTGLVVAGVFASRLLLRRRRGTR